MMRARVRHVCKHLMDVGQDRSCFCVLNSLQSY
uniref:Uncharacterized protein n=1 Tax=Anopheles quadriannulatus TaxID=34691 RepID=A0A182XS47_ANOQN